MSGLDDLDTTAVHVLRRLVRGTKVDASTFRRLPALNESRKQLLRAGLVVENTKGKAVSFGITAAGKALAPDIEALDAKLLQEQREIEDRASALRRAREAAPDLLKALQDLVAASTDPDLSSGDDDVCAAAFSRQDDATVAARNAIKLATVSA